MEMAERMGYIFHPSPYPLSFLYSTRSISHFPSPFRWNYISPATFSLSTLSRIFDAVVFSLSNRFINFQPKALTPDRVPSSSSTSFSSLSPFSPFLVSVQPSVNLSPDLGYSFSLKFPLGTDFEEIFSSSTVTFHREIDQRA